MQVRLAGVTFEGRQEKIRKAREEYGNRLDLELVDAEFNGDDCIEVFIKGTETMIGYIPKVEVHKIFGKKTKATGFISEFNETVGVGVNIESEDK